MKKLRAKLYYTRDIKSKPYLKLLDIHMNSDGSLVKIIKPENVGVVKDEVYMDMPIMYNKLNPVALNKIEKNNFYCEIELTKDNEIRTIDNLVVISI